MPNNAPPKTGATSPAGSAKSWRENGSQHGDDPDEAPPLPPRRSPSFAAQAPPIYSSNQQSVTYQRSKEHVTAYMVPLPQPRGPNGHGITVPERFMLYLPPAPDRLKPPADSDTKERKRDRAARKWQAEVRKAKTHSGPKGSRFSRVYCATIRGAVYCLALLQRSELTFLSRLPRSTLRALEFVHPAGVATSDRQRFALLKDEMRRNRRVAKRDFWLGVVLLPFAQGVDFLIPVGGGFSEVTLVWIIITGSAWRTASGMMTRLVLKDELQMRTVSREHQQAGAVAGAGDGGGLARATTADTVDDLPEKGDANQDNKNNNNSGKPSKWWHKKNRPVPPPVETVFRASASLEPLAHYLQAACYARNAAAFPDVGAPDTEAGVLSSIGWAPVPRPFEDEEERAADVAWQIRQATEDLRQAGKQAAKKWERFCEAYVKDPEKALRDEEKKAAKRAKKEEKKAAKKAQKG